MSDFSYEQYSIGGVTTHVYNSSILAEYVKKVVASPGKSYEVPIKVVYFAHGRGGDYKVTEALAKKVLGLLYAKSPSVPYVAVTFDARNHGEREVHSVANDAWDKGNPDHGIHMTSVVDGNVADLKLIIEYLPLFLKLQQHLPKVVIPGHEYKIRYINTLSGISLGGHTVLRFASEYPELVDAINPIVGCASLTTLLVNRQKKTTDYDKKYFYYSYPELEIENEDEYPRELHERLSAQDIAIFELFPVKQVRMFACFGADDKLVPPEISLLWTNLYVSSSSASEAFVQEGAGHELTKEMVEKFVDWLE